MSGSETGGVMMNREQFTLDLQKIPVTPQSASQNILLGYSADGTAVYSVSSGGGGGVGSALAGSGVQHNLSVNVGGSLKKKRGRPRMYGPNGAMTLAVTPPLATVPHSTGPFSPQPASIPHSTATFSLQPAAVVPQSTGTFSPQPAAVPQSTGTFSPDPAAVPHSTGAFFPQPATIPQSTETLSSPPHPPPVSLLGGPDSHSSFKKGRGRPPGPSKKQQMEALGSTWVGFTPHIINVKAGEDVSSKIMSFSQHGPRAVCVLSANGTISNVTLRQAATSGGTATYEGLFDILSLSGSFLLTEFAGQRSRTGGLSVSLAGPDGRVLGGCVAGLLTAASPVQVIAGSFIADVGNEMKSVIPMEPPVCSPPKLTPAGASSPPSHGTCSESSGGSPINHSTGSFNNTNPQGISSMPWR